MDARIEKKEEWKEGGRLGSPNRGGEKKRANEAERVRRTSGKSLIRETDWRICIGNVSA
jgi:hypothetical protein